MFGGRYVGKTLSEVSWTVGGSSERKLEVLLLVQRESKKAPPKTERLSLILFALVSEG